MLLSFPIRWRSLRTWCMLLLCCHMMLMTHATQGCKHTKEEAVGTIITFICAAFTKTSVAKWLKMKPQQYLIKNGRYTECKRNNLLKWDLYLICKADCICKSPTCLLIFDGDPLRIKSGNNYIKTGIITQPHLSVSFTYFEPLSSGWLPCLLRTLKLWVIADKQR